MHYAYYTFIRLQNLRIPEKIPNIALEFIHNKIHSNEAENMKYLLVSDIHGSLPALEKVLISIINNIAT